MLQFQTVAFAAIDIHKLYRINDWHQEQLIVVVSIVHAYFSLFLCTCYSGRDSGVMETRSSANCLEYRPQYKLKNETMYNFCNCRTNQWENSLRVLLGLKCTEMLYLELNWISPSGREDISGLVWFFSRTEKASQMRNEKISKDPK